MDKRPAPSKPEPGRSSSPASPGLGWRDPIRKVLLDLRTYYLLGALWVFNLVSARAARMSVAGIVGHVGLILLLVGAIVLDSRRRILAAELARLRAENAEFAARTKEIEAVLLSQRIQKETERLLPHVEEIQRRLLSKFPHCTTSFAIAENNGYVYRDELILTVKTRDGTDPAPDEYAKILAAARECAQGIDPDLVIHWA